MSKTKQTQQVLEYIKENGSIDPMRAFTDLNIMRLGARIWDLKASGVPIIKEIKSRTNESGERKHWAEYRLGDTA